MFAALLATLTCTLPRCQAVDSTVCDTFKVTCVYDGGGIVCDTARVCVPESRLATLNIYVHPWKGFRRLLRQESILGLEGQRYAFTVETDSASDVYVTTTDLAGNESCMSNGYPLNWPVGVDPAPAPPEIRWYDVAGRAYHSRPTRSGVYWERQAKGQRRLVVIR